MLKLCKFAIDNAVDAAYIMGVDGKFIYVNGAACDTLGYTMDELLELTVLDISPGFSKELWANHWKDLKKRKAFTFEYRHEKKNGETFPVEISVNYMDYKGKEYNCAFARDITERKKREADLVKSQKLESLGVLAGGIAHDFNNYLTTILGNVTVVRRNSEPGGENERRLLEAEKALTRSKDLTARLLTFATGGSPIKKAASLPELVEEGVDFALSGSNVSCNYTFDEDLKSVELDEGQFSQVINNLVINALQAMPEGGTLEIGLSNYIVSEKERAGEGEENFVRVSVKDQGAGIDQDIAGKIFEPFFTTKENGSGLGLATAYSIVNSHGGFIRVDSEIEAGSTFHVFLPAAEERAQREGREAYPDKGEGWRVLLMDDEESVRGATTGMLEHLGHDVTSAGNGEEAIVLYREAIESGEPFDAVIMDLTIPGGMGGNEAIVKLLEIDPGVKAIVTSGYSTDSVMSQYEKYGFSGVLSKPYKLEELSREIQRVIEGES